MITFQEILRRMSLYWEKQGCIIQQGYDLEVGAGTFNPATFLRCLGPEPYNAAYIEPSRRPTDGRYGENPNRLQHYFQYQTVLKPSPPNIQELYLESLRAIGFDLSKHDVRFVHDDWESQTHGAWGLGWEVWMDGMEVTQFTYFQSCGGMILKPVTGEITYGIERLSMYLQGVDSIFDLQWNDRLTYGDIYRQNEIEWSHYNFEQATVEMWFRHFDDFEKEANKLIAAGFPIPAYDFVMKASHAFNVLDARGVISVTERARYIARVRELACMVAKGYLESREKQGYPLLKKIIDTSAKLPEIPAVSEEDKLFTAGEKRDFVLEIGSEELPATFVPIGCRRLKDAMTSLLEKEELAYDALQVYGTPRRLAVAISGLITGKPEQTQERKGPSVAQAFDSSGTPLPTAAGFFRSIGVEPPTLEQIRNNSVPNVSIREVKNAEYLFASIVKPGKSTTEILAENLPKLILGLEFPKKMRWSDFDISFARPIKWVLALFGDKVIPFTVGPILSSNESQGHTQLCRGMFTLGHAGEYLERLREHKVLADIEERKQRIIEQIDQIEKETNSLVISRDDVIPQVLHLVEWPEATVASFNENYLRAPKEVVISEMVEHQKYFPMTGKDEKLVNRFVITADTLPTDHIRKGNERVLSARLSDGVFLYEKGLKVPLEEMNEKLKKMTYQKALGSVYDKMERIVKHADHLQKALHLGDPDKVRRAATLCKADLASDMVFEFPELQGVIGHYYATAQGEDPEVARSIEEHWMPRGENSPLPQSDTGIILSLADKIDNLISCFGLGLKPTSSSDPHALRRQMLGIIKILLNGRYRLPFMDTFRACIAHFPDHIREHAGETLDQISAFTTNRAKTIFQDYGLLPDEIDASVSSDIADIFDVYCKVSALHRFRKNQDAFSRLYEVYKRAKGQLQNQATHNMNPTLFVEPAEIALFNKFSDSKALFDQAMVEHDYDRAYHLIAGIQPVIEKLFDEVKILDDDTAVRENRLALLQQVFSLFSRLLDFSKIKEK